MLQPRYIELRALRRRALVALLLFIAIGSAAWPRKAAGEQSIPTPAKVAGADCAGLQAETNKLSAKGSNLSELQELQALYTQCPAYENGIALAEAEVESARYEDARALAVSLLAQQDSARAHSVLGKIAMAQKDYKAAALEYQKAAQAEPNETNVFDFGMSLFHLDHNAALTILRYGVQKYPHSIKLQVALATVLYADGKTLEGAEHFCQAQELDPADPHPMELLAETEVVPAEISARVTGLLADLHQRYKNNGLILYDYTMAQSGRWSNGNAVPPHFAESLKDALRLNPKLPQAYFQLAVLAEDQKRYREEIRLLNEAIALDAGKEQYHYRLAFAYRKAGDEAKFQDELAEFQKLHDAAADAK